MASRSYRTEAVILRSMRFSEADRILHLYTLERGRIGAIAKGARKTTSRFGARLEPLVFAGVVPHPVTSRAVTSRPTPPTSRLKKRNPLWMPWATDSLLFQRSRCAGAFSASLCAAFLLE